MPSPTQLAILLALTVLAGCQKWPGTAQLRQFQMENERLLSEFRAQKKRADDLQAKNEQLAGRLDESERLLARSHLGKPSDRISSSDPLRRNFNPMPRGSGNAGSPSSGHGLDPKSLGSPKTGLGRDAMTSEEKNLSSSPNQPQWRPTRRP